MGAEMNNIQNNPRIMQILKGIQEANPGVPPRRALDAAVKAFAAEERTRQVNETNSTRQQIADQRAASQSKFPSTDEAGTMAGMEGLKSRMKLDEERRFGGAQLVDMPEVDEAAYQKLVKEGIDPTKARDFATRTRKVSPRQAELEGMGMPRQAAGSIVMQEQGMNQPPPIDERMKAFEQADVPGFREEPAGGLQKRAFLSNLRAQMVREAEAAKARDAEMGVGRQTIERVAQDRTVDSLVGGGKTVTAKQKATGEILSRKLEEESIQFELITQPRTENTISAALSRWQKLNPDQELTDFQPEDYQQQLQTLGDSDEYGALESDLDHLVKIGGLGNFFAGINEFFLGAYDKRTAGFGVHRPGSAKYNKATSLLDKFLKKAMGTYEPRVLKSALTSDRLLDLLGATDSQKRAFRKELGGTINEYFHSAYNIDSAKYSYPK